LGIVFGPRRLSGSESRLDRFGVDSCRRLSITLFRVFSKVFKIRKATILENNIVQTPGRRRIDRVRRRVPCRR